MNLREQLLALRENLSVDLCAAAAMLLKAPTALDHAERGAALVRAHQLLVAIDAVIAEWPDTEKIEAL